MATIEQRFRRIGPQLVAEFLGTFAFVFFGAAAVLASGGGGAGGASTLADASGGALVGIALAHGLTLAAATCAFAHISRAQFNPAVSLALVLTGSQTLIKAISFIIAQLFAAASAAGTLALLLGREAAGRQAGELGATIGSLTLADDAIGVFGFEFIGTFAFMYVILAASASAGRSGPPVVTALYRAIAPLAIGGTYAAALLAAGPLTGSALNPARSFGPALYGAWTLHWVYWLAPILGACSAAAVYRLSGARPTGD